MPPSKQQCTRDNTASEDATSETDLIKEFASELEAARSRFSAESTTSHVDEMATSTTLSSTESSNTHTSSKTTDTDLTSQKPSFGHRAGFDAFMTGYVFAYYAVTQTKLDPSKTNGHLSALDHELLPLDEAMIAGLSSMTNRLSNKNKSVPLILAKSQFAKTSQIHRENCTKVAEFEKLLYKKSS